MQRSSISRRAAIAGVLLLPGCSAITRLNAAAEPRDTYDLRPVSLTAAGPTSRRNLLIADPTAPAALTSDRMLIRSNAQSIAYLPGSRWSDDVPRLFQSLLVQSLSSTGRIGFVGIPNAGPIPDVVLLTRIDRFDVDVTGPEEFRAVLAYQATLLRDRDQRVITTRTFARDTAIADDRASTVAAAFQSMVDSALSDTAIWTIRNLSG